MITVSIETPATISVPVGDTGKHTVVNIEAILKANPAMARFAMIAGFTGALNNISRGKDDNGKANSDAVWAAMRDKKAKVWEGGTWAAVERGESQFTAMWEQYLDEQKTKFGRARAEVERLKKAKVAAVFGKDEAATFNRFLDAVATEKLAAMGDNAGKDVTVASIREGIETDLAKRTADAAAERAKIAEGLDLSAIDTGL